MKDSRRSNNHAERHDAVPFSLPSIGDEEIAEVVETLKSGWLTTGARARQFEREFASFTGAKHALAVSSATAGLHLSLEAVGVGPGDAVATTPFTFTATAEVVRYLGAEVVFVDVERETMNIAPSKLAGAIRRHPKVKAVIPVHYAGQPCAMHSICQIAAEAGAAVIEDAAHALPAEVNGRHVGTLGRLGVFSFYATKPITTGEGGMVVTDDDSAAERVQMMRLHGIDRDVFDRYRSTKPSWYYEVVAPGFKYNMPDILAAIGVHQLRKAWVLRKKRQSIARAYDDALQGLPLETPRMGPAEDTHAWHLYVIRLRLEQLRISRDEFIALLAARGVQASVHFIPLHIQPYWKARYSLEPSSFPEALNAYDRVVSLPLYPDMTVAQVQRVIDVVTSILLQHQK